MTQDVHDRMLELCKRISEARGSDLEALISDLKLLLQEHSLKLENMVSIQKLLLMQSADRRAESKDPPEPRLKRA